MRVDRSDYKTKSTIISSTDTRTIDNFKIIITTIFNPFGFPRVFPSPFFLFLLLLLLFSEVIRKQ